MKQNSGQEIVSKIKTIFQDDKDHIKKPEDTRQK